MQNQAHSSFQLIDSKHIESLDIHVTEYKHLKTGAQHVHLATDNSENVFLVALRTVPEDSTGVAHILEHTALCGSEKFPVRDPFFMMIRRSLNTFMNAFTSSDWTAYPFASQNRKDFDNLLEVYLDAVFFSRLDPLDFAQEGHRLDFQESGNTNSPLMYKGVVYNEMKGAMSSVPSQLWQALNKYIFPTSTYHHNSGGDPSVITDLSYEQLQAFYKEHYHPSNAIFMTFGDIPAADHQEKFSRLALDKFEALNKTIQVKPEKRYFSPIKVSEGYAYSESEGGDDLSRKSHIVIGWLLDKSINLESSLETHLLSSLLYDNSASPLQHLLETSELGTSPSPLCGMDDSQYEMMFMCGLEGCTADSAEAVEKAVLSRLQNIVDEGLPQAQIEASLHQLELQQREIGGDGYPYGLQLILNALSPATHRGDILNFLDLESALNSLRDKIQDTNYIPQLIKRLLIENPHRVTLTLVPDKKFQERQQKAEEQLLDEIKNALTDEEKRHIVDQANALDERQNQEENMDILPKVGLEDIPAKIVNPEGSQQSNEQHQLSYYQAGTNGLCFQQILYKLPALTQEQLSVLPYYTLCLSNVGLGSEDYMSIQQRQSEIVGDIGAYYSLRNAPDQGEQDYGYLTLSSKALHRNHSAMSQLMTDTISHARFDEASRIKELVAQVKAGKEQGVTGHGHSLAMQAASASFNPIAAQAHQLTGLQSLLDIKQLDQRLQSGQSKFLQEQLEFIHEQLQSSPKHFLLISEEKVLEEQLQQLRDSCSPLFTQIPNDHCLQLPQPSIKNNAQAWITSSQVHFCARAYPTVPMGHPDSAPLLVLGGVLRNGFLHRAIREQGGAYGGGASQDSNAASFRFYSYRDPRFSETLEDFDRAIDWLQKRNITDQAIEESILGVIGSLDKPGSPAGEAKQHFHACYSGRTNEKREQFRQRIINVNAEDLYRVAETYLQPEKACTAIVTGQHGITEAEKLGMEIIQV